MNERGAAPGDRIQVPVDRVTEAEAAVAEEIEAPGAHRVGRRYEAVPRLGHLLAEEARNVLVCRPREEAMGNGIAEAVTQVSLGHAREQRRRHAEAFESLGYLLAPAGRQLRKAHVEQPLESHAALPA